MGWFGLVGFGFLLGSTALPPPQAPQLRLPATPGSWKRLGRPSSIFRCAFRFCQVKKGSLQGNQLLPRDSFLPSFLPGWMDLAHALPVTYDQ